MRRQLFRFLSGTQAVTSIEYALVASLIVLVIATGVALLGSNFERLFNTMAQTVVEAIRK